MKTKLETLFEKKFGNSEKGNTFVFVLILFPLLMACFGLAIDTAAATLTTTTLQSAADAATQSVLSQSKNSFSNNKPGLSADSALSEFVKYYDANRKGGYSGSTTPSNNSPFLLCTGSSAGGKSVHSGCGFQITSFKYNTDSPIDAIGSNISVTVREKSQTLFIRIIGVDTLDYQISSKARLTQSYQ